MSRAKGGGKGINSHHFPKKNGWLKLGKPEIKIYLADRASQQLSLAEPAQCFHPQIIKALSHGKVSRRDGVTQDVFATGDGLALEKRLESLCQECPQRNSSRGAAQCFFWRCRLQYFDAALQPDEAQTCERAQTNNAKNGDCLLDS